MKNQPQKLLIIGPIFFQYCQPTQNHPKSQILFHKNCSPHNLCIMTLDTGSDIFVSYSLFLSCHYFYGTSVLSIVFLPGLVYGWYGYSQMGFSFKKALIFPIWFMPYSLWKLVKAIFKHTDTFNGHELTSKQLDAAKL